jgi:hypothetical protein
VTEIYLGMHNCFKKETLFKKNVLKSRTAAHIAFLEYREPRPLALSKPSYIRQNTAFR